MVEYRWRCVSEGNFCKTGWSRDGLSWTHWYHHKPNWYQNTQKVKKNTRMIQNSMPIVGTEAFELAVNKWAWLSDSENWCELRISFCLLQCESVWVFCCCRMQDGCGCWCRWQWSVDLAGEWLTPEADNKVTRAFKIRRKFWRTWLCISTSSNQNILTIVWVHPPSPSPTKHVWKEQELRCEKWNQNILVIYYCLRGGVTE